MNEGVLSGVLVYLGHLDALTAIYGHKYDD